MKSILIGYGYWGKILKKYIDESDNFELIGISDPTYENSIDLDEVIRDKLVDVAFVCVPVKLHHDIVKKLLENNIHVFCEKPLTKTLKETDELIQLAEEKKLILYTDYIYTVSNAIRKMKEIVGNINRTRFIGMEISQFGNFYPDDDVFEVIGVHMLSIIKYIVGNDEPIKIARVERQIIARNGLCQKGVVFLNIGGFQCEIRLSLISSEKVRKIEIIEDNEIIKFDMMSEKTIEVAKIEEDGDYWKITENNSYCYDEKNNIALSLRSFFSLVDEMDVLNQINKDVAKFVAEMIDEIGSYESNGFEENE